MPPYFIKGENVITSVDANPSNNSEKGSKIEDTAASYLQKIKRFSLICKNYTTKLGEIDLILLDKKNKLLHFVEVKSGNISDIDLTIKKVKLTKSKKYSKIINIFYSGNKKYDNYSASIDVAVVDTFANKVWFIENITQ